MNHQTLVLAAVAVAAILLIAGVIFMGKERFITQYFNPGSTLEQGIKGYSAMLGDRRSMAEQNFGIDDSIQGVFSARIQTPKDDDRYTKVIVPSDDNPYRANNMKLALQARCNLVCSSDDSKYMKI
jgi:hypothetical protein